MKTVFNAEALVSVKIEGMRLCKQFEYQPYKKGFFFGSIEGFYDGFGVGNNIPVYTEWR